MLLIQCAPNRCLRRHSFGSSNFQYIPLLCLLDVTYLQPLAVSDYHSYIEFSVLPLSGHKVTTGMARWLVHLTARFEVAGSNLISHELFTKISLLLYHEIFHYGIIIHVFHDSNHINGAHNMKSKKHKIYCI